jgi:hypothetical protein
VSLQLDLSDIEQPRATAGSGSEQIYHNQIGMQPEKNGIERPKQAG